MNLPFNPQSIVKIQSTLFEKSIHLLLRSQSDEKNPCIYPKSPIDFATCCHLCSTISSCPEIQIRPEHTRYDIIVTNRGLMVLRSTETFRQNYICSLFPTVDIRCLEFRVWESSCRNKPIGFGRPLPTVWMSINRQRVRFFIHRSSFPLSFLYRGWFCCCSIFRRRTSKFVPLYYLSIWWLEKTTDAFSFSRCTLHSSSKLGDLRTGNQISRSPSFNNSLL